MRISIEHGMTKEEAMARIESLMPELMNVIGAAIAKAHAEYMRKPKWKRWLLQAWAIPRYGPGWAFDKYRWWLRRRRKFTAGEEIAREDWGHLG